MKYWMVRINYYIESPILRNGFRVSDTAAKWVQLDEHDFRLFIYKNEKTKDPGEGDIVMFFEKTEENECSFVSYTRLLSDVVNKEPIVSRNGEWKRIKSEYRIDKPIVFDKPRDLSLFKYSLECVYRYTKPGNHFRRILKHISNAADIYTIVTGNINWPRTFVGYLVHSLPSVLYNDFEKHCLDLNIDLKSWNLDYNLVAERLIHYYIENVLSISKLLDSLGNAVVDSGLKDNFRNFTLGVEKTEKYIDLNSFIAESKGLHKFMKDNQILELANFYDSGNFPESRVEQDHALWIPKRRITQWRPLI